MSKSQNSTPQSVDSLRDYLNQVGRIPRLTPEQEVLLGRQVEKREKLLETKEQLCRQTNSEPTTADWAQAVGMQPAELDHALEKGLEARNLMITANLKLVISIAKKYPRRGLELLDLIQEGNIGLERAVRKFEPSKGYRFSTYAYPWIRRAICRALDYQSRTIRLPEKVGRKVRKIDKTKSELECELKREPGLSDLAAAVELPPKEVRTLLNLGKSPLSLEAKVGKYKNCERHELIADERESPEEVVERTRLQEDIQDLVAELPLEQQQVLSLLYGLHSPERLCVAATARQLNLSRRRVRNLRDAAKEYMKSRKGYLDDYAIA